MPRLHKTLADYIAIAISPALIMVLVGSLVYFLAAVFYQGQYPTRLNLVLGCFVFASTLIGRISIEQGRARAAPFAIALAGATTFAMFRFVEYQGAIPAELSMVVNIGLLGVIWWAADRLVHDCTVIDEGKKSSSEGLMQTMGLDDEPARGTAAKSTSEKTTTPNLEGTTTRPGELRSEPAPETKPRSWWERNILRKGKPHTPGLWVVYFSLAALPIFGFGQGLIPQTDVANRQWAFWLFCAYLAAALGLLISTSFLGLRRYLRQRQVEMPGSMAGWWLVTGAVLVVALLVITAILPRPGAEFQLASLDVVAKSPVTNPNKHAIGGEGVETKNSGSASSQSKNPPGQNAPTTQGNRGDAQGGRSGEGGNSSSGGRRGGSSGGGQRGGNSSQNNQQGDQQQNNQQGNPPQANQASSGNNSDNKQGENSQSGGQQSNSQQNSSQQNAGSNNQGNNSGNQQSNGGQQQSNNQGNNDQSGGNRDGARGNQNDSQQGNRGGNRGGARGNGDQNDQQTGDDQQNNDQSGNRDGNRDGGRDGNRSGNRDNSQRGNSHNNSGGGGGSARPRDEQQQDDENAAGKTGDEDENQDASSSGSGSGSSFDGEAADSSSAADELDGESWFDDVDWLTTGFKWLIYIILGAVVLFVMLKYGREILRGFRDFLAGLLNIFGGKPRKKSDGEELAAEVKKAPGPPPRPFSSFADPFDTGMAGKVPPKELVRYSFEAFEAWARDRGRPRGEEETPHEFAHDVARSARSVAAEARNLADLYDRAAYAPSGVTAERAMSLSGLWKRLRGAHAASATTVNDTDEE